MSPQSHHSTKPLSVEQLRLPSDEAMKFLTSTLEKACKRLKVQEKLAATAVSQDWKWEPITSESLGRALQGFNSLAAVLIEAQRVLNYEYSKGGDRGTNALVARQLNFVHHQLTQHFFDHLSQAQDTLGVLTTLVRHPELRITSSCISALLGLHDERVGGEERRHTAAERDDFYARGGYMYQASEPFELGAIFSSLTFKRGITFYDLGSGYGHVLFWGAALRRDMIFKGIELMPARVAECDDAKSRLGLTNLSFRAEDVTAGGFSDADVIFLFNPFPPDTQGEVTDLIHQLALRKPLAIIDYGGFVTQRLTSVVPIVVADLAPYRLVASKKFLQEACDLVGMPVPRAVVTAGAKGTRRGRTQKSA